MSCCFFHDTGTLIPRHSNHQHSSEILCLSKGSLRIALGCKAVHLARYLASSWPIDSEQKLTRTPMTLVSLYVR